MAEGQFSQVNRVYWHSFGPSYLEPFLDESPPQTGGFPWHVKRKVAQFFVFVFYPIFIVVEIWGIISRDKHTLMSMSFDISLLCHNVQNFLKMRFWLTNLTVVRSLCLDFSKFHVSKHRPFLTSWILAEESEAVKKLVGRCYLITYGTVIFWFIIPSTQAIVSYILYALGLKEPQVTYIPRFSPSRYPFDSAYLMNRILVFVLETPIFSWALVYFQPIDMFLVTVVSMAQAQYKALNASLFSMPDDLSAFWSKKVPVSDNSAPMKLRYFIKDHQTMIRYGQGLREFVNPILGLVTFNCVTIICNMTIVATGQLLGSEAESSLELLLTATADIGIVLTCLVVFYTYTSIFGILKDAEESVFDALYFSDWYEKGVKFRKNMIFMQKQSRIARRIKMLGLGDMGRSTFIDGLRMIYSYYNFMQRFK